MIRAATGLVFDDDVADAVLDVIRTANQELVIVTPYLKLWTEVKRAILDAKKRGVDVTFIVRLEEKLFYNPDIDWLDDHGIRWEAVFDLHAKIYLNENTVLLSSMNLYAYSAENNYEFAYVLSDRASKAEVRQYVDELVPYGHCIRCNEAIDLNPSKPLCEKDYWSWVRQGNRARQEKYCFLCGEPANTTKARPFCADCYKRVVSASEP